MPVDVGPLAAENIVGVNPKEVGLEEDVLLVIGGLQHLDDTLHQQCVGSHLGPVGFGNAPSQQGNVSAPASAFTVAILLDRCPDYIVTVLLLEELCLDPVRPLVVLHDLLGLEDGLLLANANTGGGGGSTGQPDRGPLSWKVWCWEAAS